MLTSHRVQTDFDCVVVGAGHAGLLLARLLADHGLNTALIDQRPDPRTADTSGRRPAGWALSINLGTVTALRRAGLWDYFADHAQPVTTMRVIDPAWGRDVLYRAAEIDGEALAWGITGSDLDTSLVRAVFDQPVVETIWNEAVIGHDAAGGRCSVTCRSGRRITCRLAIAADGRQSPLRTAAGLDGPRADFGQTALTLGVTTEHSHRGGGFEVLYLGGPLAFLPLPEGRAGKPTAALTWVFSREEAARRQTAAPASVVAELSALMPEHVGSVRITTPIVGFPLSASHARRLVGRRLALVGDAAHGLHPIHAQGFNLALRDVSCLVRMLADAHRDRGDVGEGAVLRRYQAARLPDTLATSLFAAGFGVVGGSASPVARGAIGMGAILLQNVPALRAALARVGAGTMSFPPRFRPDTAGVPSQSRRKSADPGSIGRARWEP